MVLSSGTLKQSKAKQSKAKQSKAKQSKAKPFLGLREKGLEIREKLAYASVVIVAGSCGFYCNSDLKFDIESQYTLFLKGGCQPKADRGVFNILNLFNYHQTRLLPSPMCFIF